MRAKVRQGSMRGNNGGGSYFLLIFTFALFFIPLLTSKEELQ
jgi:hypothetical protein